MFNIGIFSLALLTGVRNVFGVGVINLISSTTARASHIINYNTVCAVSKYCQILPHAKKTGYHRNYYAVNLHPFLINSLLLTVNVERGGNDVAVVIVDVSLRHPFHV